MKKFLAYSFAAMTLVGSLASCSQENDVVSPAGEEVNATFSLQLPQGVQSTRSYGDGSTAINLEYGVYEKNGTALTLVTTADATFNNLQANVSVKLVTGRSYVLVFWGSDKASNAYTITWNQSANPTVAVDYTGVKQNDETRDAFFATKEVSVTGALAETVYLYRPFAQINFGTNDLTEPSVTTTFGTDYAKLQTSLTTKAYSTLDLISGAVTDQTDVTFDLAGIPSGEDFPYEPNTYSYLSMDYLLVPQDKSMVDATFNVYSSDAPTAALNTISLTNVPVQRNYQTNIFGQLLTSTHDYNVIIVPAFEEPDYNIDYKGWNGVDSEEPAEDAAGNVSIDTPAQLAGLVAKINNGDDMAGKTITLNANIDLNGNEWTPIGTWDQPFKGTFDGNGKTIKNLKVTVNDPSVNAGFIGTVNGGGKVQNLTIDGAEINTLGMKNCEASTGVIVGKYYTGAGISNCHVKNATVRAYRWTGGIVGHIYGNVTDCTVENSNFISQAENLGTEYDNGDKIGGIVGYLADGAYTVSGCTVTDCSIQGYRDLGGITGYVQGGYRAEAPSVISGNAVNGLTITQDLTHNYKSITAGERINVIWGGNPGMLNGTVFVTTSDNTSTGYVFKTIGE